MHVTSLVKHKFLKEGKECIYKNDYPEDISGETIHQLTKIDGRGSNNVEIIKEGEWKPGIFYVRYKATRNLQNVELSFNTKITVMDEKNKSLLNLYQTLCEG